jgi:hypothetical protein
MKNGLSLLLVSIVSVAGVARWLLNIDPASSFRSANVIVRQEPQSTPISSHPKAMQASKPSRSRTPRESAVIEHAPTREVSTAAVIDAGDGIFANTPKEAIAKTYGEPALSTRRVDRGHDLETLVYARDRGKEVTVILLEDGKVPSASTYSGIKPPLDTRRPDEQASALLAAPQLSSIAIPATAETPKAIHEVLKKTLAGVSTPIPSSRPPVEAKMGTCGEYRDGKLTVKPCSEVPLGPSEWLAKGSGAKATEFSTAGSGR